MKRLIPFVVLFVCATVFLSCTQEILFRDPAFECVKDGEYWLSTITRVSTRIDAKGKKYYIIEGINGKQTISIKLLELKNTTIGENNEETVSYSFQLDDSNTINYTTGAKIGSGKVYNVKHDKINNTISGDFDFVAIKTDNDTLVFGKKVVATKGKFYKVPIY